LVVVGQFAAMKQPLATMKDNLFATVLFQE
jgi:hypothetical protein